MTTEKDDTFLPARKVWERYGEPDSSSFVCGSRAPASPTPGFVLFWAIGSRGLLGLRGHAPRQAALPLLKVAELPVLVAPDPDGLREVHPLVALPSRDAAEECGGHRNTALRSFWALQAKGLIVATEVGHLGAEGLGKATKWRLTELGHMGSRPTKDFLRWSPGNDFPVVRAPLKKQNPGTIGVQPWHSSCAVSTSLALLVCQPGTPVVPIRGDFGPEPDTPAVPVLHFTTQGGVSGSGATVVRAGGRVPWRGVAGEGQHELRHGRADQSAMAGRPMMGSSGIGAMVSRVM